MKENLANFLRLIRSQFNINGSPEFVLGQVDFPFGLEEEQSTEGNRGVSSTDLVGSFFAV